MTPDRFRPGRPAGPDQARARRAGIAAIAVTSVLWGTTGTAATFAPEVGPLAIGAAAHGIAGLLQALVALPGARAAQPALRRSAGTIALGALAVAIYPLAFYSSMRLAGVAVGTVVSLAAAPLAAAVYEKVVDQRRLGWPWALAATLGTVGGALVCLVRGSGQTASSQGMAGGILLGLVAGATYAGYSWAVRRTMARGVPRRAAMGAIFGVGGAALVPVLVVTGAPLVESAKAFAVASYMVTVPMFAGYLLFSYGLVRVPASTATTVTLIEPAVAAVLAVAVVGERLAAGAWCGLGLIGLALVILVASPPTEDPLPPG
ncbi:MAG: DMT family transporter [Bifidobacteriaceae bacterium]|nr:DMT family transporter [Bifidobacteriaceae bacterium]